MTTAGMESFAAPERMRVLAGYDLFNPRLRAALDRVCQHTAHQLDMPTSMVSILLDSAQFFAGSHGLEGWLAAAEGTPIEWSFCARAALAGGRVYVVEDAPEHPAHRDSPLVTREGTRAYAGVAVRSPDGQVVGMHCVVSTSPRRFSDADLGILRKAADEVTDLLESYRQPLVAVP